MVMPFSRLYGLTERYLLARLFAAALAGICLAFVVEWVGHLVTPTTVENGVVTASSTEPRPGRGSNYTIQARLDSGRSIDLGGRNSVGLVEALTAGEPVTVTRSTLDGQVLGVRTPSEEIDTNFAGLWIARGLILLGLGLLGWMGLRRFEPLAIVATLAAAVAVSVILWTGPELDADAGTDRPGRGEPAANPS